MTQLIQYKCPVCSLNSTARKFISNPITDPLDLGYIIVRECRGRKGFPMVSSIALALTKDNKVLSGTLLKTLKHNIIAVLHSLYKQGLISYQETPFINEFKNYENVFMDFETLKSKNQNLESNYEDLYSENSSLIEENNELKSNYENLYAEYQNLSIETTNLKNQFENTFMNA